MGVSKERRIVEWLGAIGYRHQAVMSALMRGGTVIPLRAFTLFANETSLRNHVKAERENFIRILDLDPRTRARYDLSSLRVVLHAAAPCPVPVKRAFMDLVGPEKVFEYFGATEGGGTAISPQE